MLNVGHNGPQLAVKTFMYFRKTLTTQYLIHEEI